MRGIIFLLGMTTCFTLDAQAKRAASINPAIATTQTSPNEHTVAELLPDIDLWPNVQQAADLTLALAGSSRLAEDKRRFYFVEGNIPNCALTLASKAARDVYGINTDLVKLVPLQRVGTHSGLLLNITPHEIALANATIGALRFHGQHLAAEALTAHANHLRQMAFFVSAISAGLSTYSEAHGRVRLVYTAIDERPAGSLWSVNTAHKVRLSPIDKLFSTNSFEAAMQDQS